MAHFQRETRGHPLAGGYLTQLGLAFGGTFILDEVLDAARTALQEGIKRRRVASRGHR